VAGPCLLRNRCCCQGSAAGGGEGQGGGCRRRLLACGPWLVGGSAYRLPAWHVPLQVIVLASCAAVVNRQHAVQSALLSTSESALELDRAYLGAASQLAGAAAGPSNMASE
jgi:hypothetical protein